MEIKLLQWAGFTEASSAKPKSNTIRNLAFLNDVQEQIALQLNPLSIMDMAKIDRMADGDNQVIILDNIVNNLRYINKSFETINKKLCPSGYFIGFADTYPCRKQAFLDRYPPVLNRLLYALDYIFKRVAPKVPVVKKVYFFLTKGKRRVVSRAEVFGRLYACGFEIVDEKMVDRQLRFISKKIKDPVFDKEPTYGPLIKLRRIGKNGRMFKVYKLRTMHPFSEYLQDYVYKQNKLKKGGKIKNDFRVTPEGRLFRKLWIDELPMLWNLIKGDMKLVGVRPLSEHFFSLYDEDLQALRTQYKPGLIPPFYADMPETIEDIMDSERKYLKLYYKHPIRTDIYYFMKAFKNIVMRGARSQ